MISYWGVFMNERECERSYIAALCFHVAVGGAGGGVGIPLAAGGYQGQNIYISFNVNPNNTWVVVIGKKEA